MTSLARRTLRLVVVLCSSLLLLTACGSDDTTTDDAAAARKADRAEAKVADAEARAEAAEEAAAEAEDQVRQAYVTSFTTVGEQLDGVGDQFLAAKDWNEYSEAVTVLGTIVTSLDGMTPPADIEQQHNALLHALKRSAVAARRITANSSEATDEAASAEVDAALDSALSSVEAIQAKLD